MASGTNKRAPAIADPTSDSVIFSHINSQISAIQNAKHILSLELKKIVNEETILRRYFNDLEDCFFVDSSSAKVEDVDVSDASLQVVADFDTDSFFAD